MSSTRLPAVPANLLQRGVALRVRTPEDAEFIRDVYVAYRWDEVAPTGWPDHVKLAFLHDQHRLQAIHYEQHYQGAAWGVIEVAGERARRLYLLQQDSDLRIVDIALMPACRNLGIGTGLLAAVQSMARDTCVRKVSIHVERNNPALRLYERLGFCPVETRGVYYLLEWCVPQPALAEHRFVPEVATG